jgi:hypothetical protein
MTEIDGGNDDTVDFLVRRDRLSEYKFVRSPPLTALGSGQVDLAIDQLGFTCNNLTYALRGDALGYWSFFPAPDADWGRIPAWGFGTVLRSECEGVSEGERFYGYFPMSTRLRVQAVNVNQRGFVDATQHRRMLHPAYNAYIRTTSDPLYTPATERQQVILRPLMFSAFLLADALAENELFGGDVIILSSASSKLAYSIAFLLTQQRKMLRGFELVGLTSAPNRAFAGRVGVYDGVLPYSGLDSLPRRPAVYLDVAGDAAIRRTVHRQLGTSLKHSCRVGSTHRPPLGPPEELPGPTPVVFSAAARAEKRTADWTADGLGARMSASWQSLLSHVAARSCLKTLAVRGSAAVAQVYRELLDGNVRPDEGHVLSLRT